ncbi:MAG: hypothetical protein JO168_07245 [Solirubrobacterales bacterium]|nr:hypothetical protein [Solirubrobacterales bacterium]MBV9714494.1 hypothetical protein [Solirubrobacterales bacterium]
MNAERTRAYRRVMHTLSEAGPSKLLDEEQDRLRHAADTLLFSQRVLDDDDSQAALADTERLCRWLVDSGRWQEVTAMRLADDVAECGPEQPGELRAA